MSDPEPSRPAIQNPQESRLIAPGGISPVWLVPLVALGIALYIAWSVYSGRGPVIEIEFADGDGIVANETTLKFRNVTVGMVEDVDFTDDLSRVVVAVRLHSNVAEFVDSDARFWIVRPEVSARGVTGLTTVLSGIYLQGDWDNQPGTPQTRFDGLDSPPLVAAAKEGTQIILRAASGGQLHAGSPLVFRGVSVGYLGEPRLSEDGKHVTADAFIEAPYDGLLTSNSRFWGLSGFTLNVGSSGISLDVGNLASLVQGGVGFSTIISGGSTVEDGQTFDVYDSEETARSSVFAPASLTELPFAVLFDGTISGLSEGAPVEFQGLRVGEVKSLSAHVTEIGANREVDLRADIVLTPERLGLPEGSGEDETLEFLRQEVAQNGLRARLTNQNLLSSSLKIELVEVANVPPAEIVVEDQVPILPNAPAQVSDVSATAQGVMERINSLPVEELMQAATDVLGNVNGLLSSDAIRQVPAEVVGLLADARGVVGSEDAQGLAAEAKGAVTDIRAMIARLNEGTAINSLLQALERSNSIAQSIDSAVAGLPSLVEQIDRLAEKANSLPLGELTDSANQLILSVNAIAASPDTQSLPASVNSVLTDLAASLKELRDTGAVTNLSAALARADSITQSVDLAASGLPALIEQINVLSLKANQLPLNELVTSADQLVQSASLLVSSPDTAQIPAALADALDQLGQALQELREGGVVENANATLASASAAAQSIEQAAASLPELANRLESLSARAESVMGAYDDRSQFNAQSLAALRDLRDAARAVTSLARQLERNPNQLIMGR